MLEGQVWLFAKTMIMPKSSSCDVAGHSRPVKSSGNETLSTKHHSLKQIYFLENYEGEINFSNRNFTTDNLPTVPKTVFSNTVLYIRQKLTLDRITENCYQCYCLE